MPFMLRARTRAETSGVTRRATQAKLWPLLRRLAISGSVVRLSSGSVWTIAARLRAAACLSSIFGGHGVDGVDLHGHGEFAHIAVIEDAAAGSHLKGALLLLLRALDVFGVADDLEPEETACDGEGPEKEKKAHKPEARQLHGHGARCGAAVSVGAKSCLHGESLAKTLSSSLTGRVGEGV